MLAFRQHLGLAIFLVGALRVHAIVISEVMYHPQSQESLYEYVELYNETATRIDLGRWRFTAGIDYTFPPGTLLEPRSYLVVARNPAALMARYGITNVVGPFSGALDNSSDHLVLRDTANAVQAELDYSDDGKWPVAADGASHSLSKLRLRHNPDDPDNWRASILPGGTPGRDNGFEPVTVDTVLIAPGDLWRYFKGRTEASTPLDAWRQIAFDDSAWLSGPTGIGYGDGDDATVLTDMQNQYWSVFCRKTFVLSDPASISSLMLEVDHDDGFIAYLNGQYVGHHSMTTTNPVYCDTPAVSHAARVEGGALTVLDLTPYKGLLQAGPNVLAVQVHNASLNSSDLSFIPTLRERRVIQPMAFACPLTINEVCFNTSGTQFIEICNSGTLPFDASGYFLSNDPDNVRLFSIPAGTIVAGGATVAFLRSQLGFSLNPAGDRILLTSPTADAVLDARAVEPGPRDWSEGRWPDGADNWFNMAPTTGTANAVVLTTSVVINEIMYHPVSEDDADEYIELHNIGSSAVSLAGWSFTRGISYDFPTTTVIPAGGYLVVARDRARLTARYGLDPSQVLGNYRGNLDDGGEKIRLRDANGNTADEVTYSEGGRWPEYADGYGSSLELMDPRQDNNNPQSWGPSDERSKAQWTSFTVTGMANCGSDPHEHELHLILLGPGECFIDDIHLTRGGTEYLDNGGFESGVGSWVIMGNHVQSRVTSEAAFSGANGLHLVATGPGDTGANHIECDTALALPVGQWVTLTFRAKWQWGNRHLVTRLWDNPSSSSRVALRETHALPIPAAMGTPGTTNSIHRANLGPVFSEVRHAPVVPRPSEPVQITARVSDADGITSVAVYYRPHRDTRYTSAPMYDDGAHGDSRPGDGIYGGTIPPCLGGLTSGTVAFYLEGRDPRGAVNTWPTNLARPALYRAESTAWASNLPTYRIVMTPEDLDLLFSRPHLSNEALNCTFIADEREVYYCCGVGFTGSPHGRRGNNYRGYEVKFNDDEKLWGYKYRARCDKGQNAGYRDHITYDLMRYMGVAYCYGEWVDMRVNQRNEGVNEDILPPSRLYLDSLYRGDSDGHLHELAPRFEFTRDNDLDLYDFTSVGGSWTWLGSDKDLYRWNYRPRNHDNSDDFTSMTAAIEVMSRIPNNTTEAEVASIIDVRQWLRVFTVRAINSDWDAFGTRSSKNGYVYAPHKGGRWQALPWDCELGFGMGYTTMSIWATGPTQIVNFEQFRSHQHYYLNSVHEYFTKYFTRAHMDPWVDHYYSVIGGYSPTTMKSFIDARRVEVQKQLAPYLLPAMPCNITSPDPLIVPGTTASLTGVAPVNVSYIRYWGAESEPQWSNATQWTFPVTVLPATNTVTLEFLDYDKNLVGTDTITLVSTLGMLQFVTDKNSVTVPEGGTATFSVRLSGSPSSPLAAAVYRAGGDSDITVESGATLNFDAANWSTPQTVVLRAAEDLDAASHQATIRIHATSGPFTGDKDVTAVEADNDTMQFVTSTAVVIVPEGGTAAFQVKLNCLPTQTLYALVYWQSGDSDISVQGSGSLMFTPENWNQWQSVTLAAARDADSLAGEAVVRIIPLYGAAIPATTVIAREMEWSTGVRRWREY